MVRQLIAINIITHHYFEVWVECVAATTVFRCVNMLSCLSIPLVEFVKWEVQRMGNLQVIICGHTYMDWCVVIVVVANPE